ncbi:MAG: copper resistance protein NlpE [Ferruginibacter sp.]
MNIAQVLVLGTVIGLSACTGSDNHAGLSGADSTGTLKLATESNMITAAIDSTNSQNTPKWKGTYEGVFPCDDCVGTVIKLMLNVDSSYMITVKYLKPKDSKETTWEGKFVWITASTIQLQASREIRAKYIVAENKLIQLDVNGRQVEGEMAHKYILNKTDLK